MQAMCVLSAGAKFCCCCNSGSGTGECPGGRVMHAMGVMLSVELATITTAASDCCCRVLAPASAQVAVSCRPWVRCSLLSWPPTTSLLLMATQHSTILASQRTSFPAGLSAFNLDGCNQLVSAGDGRILHSAAVLSCEVRVLMFWGLYQNGLCACTVQHHCHACVIE